MRPLPELPMVKMPNRNPDGSMLWTKEQMDSLDAFVYVLSIYIAEQLARCEIQ